MFSYFSIKRNIIDFSKALYLRKFYTSKSPKISEDGKAIIAMVDGKIKHGGLSDRICGIVSVFQYCVTHNIKFKIYFKYPFHLESFLIPNKYDWTIRDDEVSNNSKDASAVYISYISYYSRNPLDMRHYADRKLNIKKKQIHVYSNMRYFGRDEFSYYFNMLFKKTPLLEQAINDNIASLGNNYVSITFRFQQLLGDFKETGFPTLKTELERTSLIKKCIHTIARIYEVEKKKVLVTSDSKTFLDEVKRNFDFVYIIPGKVAHMDYENKNNPNIELYLKSFVDFFLIAGADTVYLGNIKPLYRSSFPETAAMVYKKNYYEIDESF